MTPLVVDAGVLIASQSRREPHYAEVGELLSTWPGPIATTQIVLAEVDYMLTTKVGVDAELRLLDDVVEQRLHAEPLSDDEMRRAVEVIARYRDLEVGLADASLVVLAARYRTRTIATLDERCFRAMTPLNGGAFTLLPADD